MDEKLLATRREEEILEIVRTAILKCLATPYEGNKDAMRELPDNDEYEEEEDLGQHTLNAKAKECLVDVRFVEKYVVYVVAPPSVTFSLLSRSSDAFFSSHHHFPFFLMPLFQISAFLLILDLLGPISRKPCLCH